MYGKVFESIYNGTLPRSCPDIHARIAYPASERLRGFFHEVIMKTFTGQYIAQGDLNIFAVDEIPALAETDDRILAHSETGHHHVLEGNAIRVYRQDDFVSYLDVQETAKVVHLRGFDTHETVNIPAGKYRVTRQREYTIEGFRRAAD